jgi:hypothetical protein
MSTNSTIALEYADGTVDSIYCHSDGYLSYNGKMLLEHYSDPFKVRQLMDLGDMSFLAKNIGEKHNFNDYVEDSCRFYGRDRGEQNINADRFGSFDSYRLNNDMLEYNYILRKDGNWYVRKSDQTGFRILKDLF